MLALASDQGRRSRLAPAARAAGRLARRGRAALVAFALATSAASAQAPGEWRVALVIGNGGYPGTAALPNAGNDATAMAAALRRLGFTVIELRDARRDDMAGAIARAGEALKGRRGVGMLYYAGHGLQLDWRNYMVPVDARLAQAADVAQHAVDVESVIAAFKAAGNRMNIVVLDACRDNPFGQAASARGLAPMDAPPGTFLAYATAPGNVAEDGTGANGLYTEYLLQELQRPAARIEDVFKRVRLHVRQRSGGRQIPWESTSLEEDFSFGSAQSLRPEELERLAADARGRERELLQQAAQARERDREAHLAAAREAERQRIDAEARLREQRLGQPPDQRLGAEFSTELADWNRIKDSGDARDFYDFLKKYPSGLTSEKAESQLQRLAKARIVAQAGRDGIAPLPAGESRYRKGDALTYRRTEIFGQVRTYTLRVTGVDGDVVTLNDGQGAVDRLGNLIRNGAGVRNPARQAIPAELQLHRRWRSAYEVKPAIGPSHQAYYDYKVAALEDVTVPAGTFKAWRIEGAGFNSPWNIGLRHVTWVDAASGLILREDWRTLATPPEGYRAELVEFRRGADATQPAR